MSFPRPLYLRKYCIVAHYLFQSRKNNFLLVNEEGLFCHLTTSPSYHASELKVHCDGMTSQPKNMLIIPSTTHCNIQNSHYYITLLLLHFLLTSHSIFEHYCVGFKNVNFSAVMFLQLVILHTQNLLSMF